MTTKFSCGYNLPGYLPEADPHVETDFEQAKAVMLWELDHGQETWGQSIGNRGREWTEGHARWDEAHEELQAATRAPWSSGTMPDGYRYWIEEAGP